MLPVHSSLVQSRFVGVEVSHAPVPTIAVATVLLSADSDTTMKVQALHLKLHHRSEIQELTCLCTTGHAHRA